MPYNNTPIAPTKEITGTVALPLARVKKIIAADDDISNCSNNAAFMITIAAEMFLQHLVEQSYNIVKSERKPRRNIQYRDVANAVARVENLEFLTDVVPKTTTYKQVKSKARQQPGQAGESSNAAEDAEQAATTSDTPSNQLRIEDAMQSRMIRPEEHAISPKIIAPTSEIETVVEEQATNGAAKHEDAMDVDEEEVVPPVEKMGDPAMEGPMDQP